MNKNEGIKVTSSACESPMRRQSALLLLLLLLLLVLARG
jgi:hypothetical protein